jgi:hypothetical protein
MQCCTFQIMFPLILVAIMNAVLHFSDNVPPHPCKYECSAALFK